MKELNNAFEEAKKDVARRNERRGWESAQQSKSAAYSTSPDKANQSAKKATAAGSNPNPKPNPKPNPEPKPESKPNKANSSANKPKSPKETRRPFDSWSNWIMSGFIAAFLITIWVGSRDQFEFDRPSGSTSGDEYEAFDIIVNGAPEQQAGRSTADLVKPDPTLSIPKSTTETANTAPDLSANEILTPATAPETGSISVPTTSTSNTLKLSNIPITVSDGKYELWYEGVKGFGPRYLALDFIADGTAYFRDASNRELEFSIHSITDLDLERIIRYIGRGNGNFLLQLPGSRSWNMEVDGVPVRGHLAGLLNRIVVIRRERSREYVLVELGKLLHSDREYILSFCN